MDGAEWGRRLLLPGDPATGGYKHFPMTPALMIPLLTVVGLAGFWLFYRSVDFFDRI